MAINDNDKIVITGARVHNLKNIDLEIPRHALVVITGLSGSGKSSLAFDTIYAEGQRRYMETLSTYARQFVGTMERPDVDKISGLSPVVAIEQKTTNKNPRSTVGTVTEINDFLRLLYARVSHAFSPVTGEEMVHYSDDRICQLIIEGFDGRRVAFMAPIVKGRKGHYRELFESLAKRGYIYARIDGVITEITAGMKLDRYKVHNIELVVDRMVVNAASEERIMASLKEAMRQGKGTMALYDYDADGMRYYSRRHRLRRPGPVHLLVQLAAGRLPAMQRSGRGGRIRYRQDHPRPQAVASRGRHRALGQIQEQQDIHAAHGSRPTV